MSGLTGIHTPARRLFLNGTAVLAGEAVARIATMAVALLVARRFGPEALGDYGFAIAVASILGSVPDFGLHLYTVREIARSPLEARRVFWKVHWVKLALTGLVVTFTLAFSVWIIPGGERAVLLGIFATRAVLHSFSQATMAVFRAFERMHYLAIQQLTNAAVVCAWITVSHFLAGGLPVVAAGLVAGQTAETLLGWSILRRWPQSFRVVWPCGAVKSLVLACLPIGVTAMLLSVSLRMDVLVLSRYVGGAELGQFSAAIWFVTAAFLGASLLTSVLFPKLARLLASPSPRGGNYVGSLLKNALWVGGLAGLAVWLSAPVLVRMMWGNEFVPAIVTLRSLTPALPLVFLNTILFYVFVASGRQVVCLVALSTGVLFGIAFSVPMSASYGAVGCALAGVARELVVNATYLLFLRRRSETRLPALAILRVVVVASLAAAIGAGVVRSLAPEAFWVAAWVIFMLVGTGWVLGLPRPSEWRRLGDDAI